MILLETVEIGARGPGYFKIELQIRCNDLF